MAEIETEGYAARHRRAVALHQAGEIAEALALYTALLEAQPADPEILGLLALAQLQLGREQDAVAAWRKSMSVESPAPIRLRTTANLLTAIRRKGSAQASGLFADLIVPEWPRGVSPDQTDRHMLITLARGLLDIDRGEAACKLLDSVLSQLSSDTAFVTAAMAIMIDAGYPEMAVRLLRPLTSEAGKVDGNLLIAHAAAAHAAGHAEEAQRLTRRAMEAVPVYVTAKEPTQLLLVGVLNKAPVSINRTTGPAYLHFAANTPATLATRHNDQYRFVSIFPEARAALRALASLPRPHVILNNWVNAEMLSTPRTLQFITDFADRLGLPVLNHPRKAVETTRQKNADRLAGIPNLLVPRLVRFTNEPERRDLAVRVVGEKVGFPAIIRGPFGQRGAGAVKIATSADLRGHLASLPGMQLYAIEYVHNPAAAGVYRKIRAAVIGQDVFITHVHLGPRWNVHRERDGEERAAFDPDGRQAALASSMIARPEETLGAGAMAVLREIRARIPLDLYGIDFDVTPDGRVLFFEANAAMNLSMSDRKGLETTRAAMRAALRRLFQNPP
ncbi:MAG: hypothetical protein AB7S92_03025 [Parvibaculaceae bacterium]